MDSNSDRAPEKDRQPGPRVRALAAALRPAQWAKNVLVFGPLVLAHRFEEADLLLASGLAAAAMCAASSGVYLVNDAVDADSDRRHPLKRFRPVASGAVKKSDALGLAVVLQSAGVALAAAVNPETSLLVVCYLASALAYTLWIKRILMLDIVLLAMLYQLRVYLGGAATGIPVSDWTALFCLMSFLSLASTKRFAEIVNSGGGGAEGQNRRAYRREDGVILLAMGISASIGAVIALGLYTGSPDVARLYRRPDLLRVNCAVLLAWFGRLWFEVHRGRMKDEDPLSMVVKEPWSLGFGLLAVLVFAASI